jgi:hypothetical protein
VRPGPAGYSSGVTSEPTEEALEAARREADQLREAMTTRAPIEQAKGMLMLLLDSCDDDQAFEVLVQVSQGSHRKLHDVAGELCETVTTSNTLPDGFVEAYQRVKKRT